MCLVNQGQEHDEQHNESRYEDDEQCSFSDRVFTTITSLAFAVLAAMDPS